MVFILLAFTLFLRLPTLSEPYWYGDEGIYLTIGHAIRQGEILYRDIHDNKPPLIYYVAAVANGDQFWYRFIALGWNLATVGVFYGLSKAFFGKRYWTVAISTFLFILLTNIPMFEGNVANGEIFFLLPTLLATYLLFTTKHTEQRRFFLAGILFGVAGLFKLPALVEAGVWPVYWLVFERKTWLKRMFCLCGGVSLVLIVSLIYFAFYGVAGTYFRAAIGQNVAYVSSWGTGNLGGIYTLTGRALLVVGALFVLLVTGKRTGPRAALLTGWIAFAVFGALLSGRPYPHYVLQVMGAGSLGLGVLIFGTVYERLVIGGIMALFGLCLGLVLSRGDLRNFPTYPTIHYYQNYFLWVTGRESKEAYFQRFDVAVGTTYQISTYIRTHTQPDEKIFIWGDQPLVYALAKRDPVGKYTAAYHIKDFRAESETLTLLKKTSPRLVVSYGNENGLPGFEALLEQNYRAVALFGNARIYRYLVSGSL